MRNSSIALLIIMSISTLSVAQDSKKVKTEFETIKEQCTNLPLDQRIRMVVARFNVTTPSATTELGENMATMLTNALTETNCFRMMEMLKNADDWKGELEYGNSAAKERNNRAQVVVNGEVTEFTKVIQKGGVAVVKTSKEIVKLGFIIKLINPETRDILFSKSINVEGKGGAGTNATVLRSFGGGVHLGSSDKKSAAVANALEQGIIQAAEFIGEKKDLLNLPAGGGKSSSATSLTQITVNNTDYDRMSGLESKIKGLSGIKSVESSLDGSVATLTVEHSGTIKEMIDMLKASSGNTFSIQKLDANAGKVTIAMN